MTNEAKETHTLEVVDPAPGAGATAPDELKDQGTSAAARQVPCAENTMRMLERRKVVRPIRDSGGRRLFGPSDIRAAREYLKRNPAAT
ncbi:MAG: hypothetical protein IT518_22450 [Burkholderiales bacterium]|nr:hypothetical protein [Burkholderiales bacterium]